MPTTRLRFALLLAAILFCAAVFAQVPPDCGGPPADVPPAESCPEACVYCDFNGYMGSTAGYFANGHPGGGFCGQVQNDQWLGFIAGAASATFTVQPSNCMGGNGIQAALYDNCSSGPLLACTEGGAGQGEMPAQFTVALLPGKTYYLMIDGFSGDECDIQVSVDPPSAVQPPNVGPVGAIQGPMEVCPGATVTYQVPTVTGAGIYTWSGPNPSVTFNGEFGPASFVAPDGRSVQVNFPSNASGSMSICVQADNACKTGSQVCKTVLVKPIPPTVLPDTTVFVSELPYVLPWGDDAIFSQNPSINSYSTTFTSWLGCDSIVKQKVTVTNPAKALIFWDTDGDGAIDPGEGVAIGIKVRTQKGLVLESDTFGCIEFPKLKIGDTLRVMLPSLGMTVKPAFHLYKNGHLFQFGLHAPSTGLVFLDTNHDLIYDPGEPLAAGVNIKTQNGKIFTTDSLGSVTFLGLKPGDTLRIASPIPGAVSIPAFWVYKGQAAEFRFALWAQPGAVPDVSVDLTNTNVFRQGFTTNLVVTVRNEGVLALASNTVAQVLLPYPLEYLGAVPGLTAKIGDTLLWSLGALPAGATRTILLQVRTRLGTANGTPLSLLAWARPFSGEAKTANNYATLQTATVGSFDPNDKQVRPAHVTPAILSSGQAFEYTVRFQNTGDFPADFVRVVDVLADEIDPSSLRLLASSHACTWSFPAPNTVEFFFENIQLPDSVSNEPSSHGFLKFSVLPRKGLPLGTAVENACDIYFDFNDPVRTNTVGTQVVAFLPGDAPVDADELLVRPNPAAFRAFCQWETPAPAPGTLWLFNIWGLPVREAPVDIGNTEGALEVMGLAPGVYVVWLEAGGLRLVKTLVVQSSWMELIDP